MDATAQDRIAKALQPVTDWDGVDIDQLYDEQFPQEVDRHTFRQACMDARGAAQHDPAQLTKHDARKLSEQMSTEKADIAREREQLEQDKAEFASSRR